MSLFHRIIWILNIFALGGLGLAMLAAYVNPEHFWWLSLFGLGFEILLVINLIFVLFWLLVQSKRFLFSLALVILGIGKVFGIIQVHPFATSQEKLAAKGYVKVMTFNVRLFDLYNWFHNNQTRGRIFNFLSAESPDIVCFQEFYSSDKKPNKFKNDDTLKKVLNARYSQIEYTVTLRKTDHWGIATYSKYPIVHQQSVHYAKKGGSIFIFSDIKIGADTVRVFNTHLESVRFGWNDYHFIENINKDDVEQDEVAGSLHILRRLKHAFVVRAQQIKVLKDSINASPYKVIVCGDFNDTPSSYTYHYVSSNLEDAFRESANGLGKTYSGPFPSFRIDYILHDPGIKSAGYKTLKAKLSDHYPISCWIKVE